MIDYKTPDEEEIQKMALAFAAGTVFTSLHFTDEREFGEMLPSVFLPIGLAGIKSFFTEEEFVEFKPIFYQYLEEAGPRSVNGFPIFFSVKIMKWDDFNTLVRPRVLAIAEAKGAVQ